MPSSTKESKSAATIRRRKLKSNHNTSPISGASSKNLIMTDELLQEDEEPAISEPVSGPPIIKLLMSTDWILFLGLLAFRCVNALFIQTSFVADEYWQSLEVAHRMVFGYGYLTWEWRQQIRGTSYPLLFAALYKLLDLFHLDNRLLLIKLPRVLQAVFSALGDLYLYKTARKLSGNGVARWSLLCQLTSWFTFFTSVRTLTNSMETSLSTIALYFYPWPGAPRKAQWKYMCLIGLAVVVRPTAAILWIPLCIWHLWLYRQKLFKVLVLFFVTGLCILAISSWIDHAFYGQWTLVQLNFLRFNVLSDLSTFYGSHPWHWYLTQGFPVIMGPQLVLFVLAVWKSQQPFVLALIGWTITVYSLLAHKEFRFIFPILPLAMYQCGLYLHSITHNAPQADNNNTMQDSPTLSGASNSSNKANKNSEKTDSSDKKTRNGKIKDEGQEKKTGFLVTSHLLVGLLIVTNLPVALYTSLLHQRGTIDVMQFVHQETKYEQVNYNSLEIMYLMPCHSTPYYSYIHKNISMRFLTCEAPLSVAHSRNYTDEADVFYQNPRRWLINEYFSASEGSSQPQPTHLVMFNVLHVKLSTFLEEQGYHKCAKFFHSHIHEGRVGSHVIVMCHKKWTMKKEKIKKQREKLYM